MTEKLYYQDTYCREFEALVTACEEGKSRFGVVLDRTAFYPEGGGQPGDTGYLHVCGEGETVKVLDTHEKNGEVVHYTDRPLEAGVKVRGKIDWQHRMDLMQNHSGEHIVSGLIHEKFGYENVGFHMGKDMITIDLNGEFTAEDMREIERRANQVVWENVPVQICNYTEEEVKTVEYRSKKELHGSIRIVTFPGADVCACCGTHVKNTGEIGLIKLISLQKFKGGMRMEMLCGRKAYLYVEHICSQNQQISVALSAKPMETAAAVERLKTAAADTAYRLAGLEEKLFEEKAACLTGKGDVLLFEENLSADSVRRLAAAVMETCGGRCVVCSGTDEAGYKYAIGEKDGDLRETVKEFNTVCSGRGGGKPFFVQGSVNTGRAEIEEFWKNR
ncbi:MAG: alanyl-tRNA editing protein [Eubacteriales bacterium]|nr:alanyl-tRNA editing protein [Eubacteriales bacterium]